MLTAAIEEEKKWIRDTLKRLEDEMNELNDECLNATDITKRYCDGMLYEDLVSKANEAEASYLGLKSLYDNYEFERIIPTRDWVKRVFFAGKGKKEQWERLFKMVMSMQHNELSRTALTETLTIRETLL